MKRLSLILIVCLCLNAQAQVAGYMGKRLILMHNSFYGPAFVSPSIKKTDGFRLNFTKSLGLEFSTRRCKSICLAAQYYLTGVSYDHISKRDENIIGPAKLSATQFSLGVKKFSRKTVAQIGFYIKLDLLYQQFKVNYDTVGFYDGYGGISGGAGVINMKGVGTAFSIGKQRIFADKIVIDYGLRLSVNSLLSYNFPNFVEKSMAYNSYYRILNHQFFNLNLGIGFLAY